MNRKVIKNAAWIIGCKIAQSVLAFIISMLTARYLGPSNFGTISYAQSVTTFFLPIVQLGFNSILVREIINNSQNEGSVIGTSMLLSFFSSLFSMAGIALFCYIVDPKDSATLLVCILYSVSLIFQSMELIQYWFQAKYLSMFPSIVSFFAYLAVSFYKFYLLYTSKSIYWFAVSYAIDYCIISAALIILYFKLGGPKFGFSSEIAKSMFHYGKYYIISGLMITIFSETDRVMLKLMVNETETGYYAAAYTCMSLAAFIFTAINDSMRPFILENRKKDLISYEKSVVTLYAIIIYTAVLYAIFLIFFSKLIISIVYGSDYSAAIIVLQILAWYPVFAYYGGAKDIWILAENKQKNLLLLNGCGAVCNIMLNFFFIPVMGASGAAFASVITNFFVNIIMISLIPALRRNNVLLLKALNFKNFIIGLKQMKLRKM